MRLRMIRPKYTQPDSFHPVFMIYLTVADYIEYRL